MNNLEKKILTTSSSKLKIILKSVYEDTFDYEEDKLAYCVLASKHMKENEGDAQSISFSEKQIWDILIK